MATPTLISVSNVALPSSADSGSVSVTAPSGANACVIGGTGYIGDNNAPTSLTGSQLSAVNLLTRNGNSGAFMTVWAAHAKVLATGSQTIRLQKTGTWGEGPTCQIIWLTVDNPDDFVRAWTNSGASSNLATPDDFASLSVTIASATTDLVVGLYGKDSNDSLVAPTGTTQQGTTQTTNSDSSMAFKVTTPGASTTTVTTANISYPTLSAIALKEGSGAVTHASTGTLTGQGATVAGSAARTRAHPSSGALTGQGATVVGSAAHNVPHASSGDLVGQGSTVAGSAARTRQHASSGDLVGDGSTVAGSAARTRGHDSSGVLTGPGATVSGAGAQFRAFDSSGALTGPGSTVAGSADHQSPAGSHDATGALVGQGSTASGSAAHVPNHQASGALVGQGSSVAGTAVRSRSFASSGALAGQGSTVAGAANHSGSPVSHNATGALVGQGSTVYGIANGPTGLEEPVTPTYVPGKKAKAKERKLMGGPRWKLHELEDVWKASRDQPAEVAEKAGNLAHEAIAKAKQEEIGAISAQVDALVARGAQELELAQQIELERIELEQQMEDAAVMEIIAQML